MNKARNCTTPLSKIRAVDGDRGDGLSLYTSGTEDLFAAHDRLDDAADTTIRRASTAFCPPSDVYANQRKQARHLFQVQDEDARREYHNHRRSEVGMR